MIGTIMEVNIEFLTKVLGTASYDEDIHATYIASKAEPNGDKTAFENMEDELKDVPKKADEDGINGTTGFLTDDEGLYIKNHMIKGFLKSAAESLIENGTIKKIPAYKKWIDRMVFISPVKIHFGVDKPDGFVTRSLRATTPKGDRVAIAKSDCMNEGRKLSFKITLLNNTKGLTPKVIQELLSYGQFVGLGQWRGSGGHGQFKVNSVVTYDQDDNLTELER